MATRQGNPDQYLQKVGGTYYARVRVPRTLEKYAGQTHIRRSLQTGDRSEANRKKHSIVASIKDELARMRKAPNPADVRGITFADAKQWRDNLLKLEASGDHEQLHTLGLVATDVAEEVERLYGHDKAVKWYRAATTTADNLKELMDRWMDSSDYKESTKAGHRKALAEVLAFLDNESALPSDITRKVALSYIDTDLTQRGLAHATIRDRLVSLGGFWSYLASRGAVPEGVNPWSGHRISKKQHASSRPTKRAFTEAELLALFKGTEEAKAWPTYGYLPDLMVLGLFTGARVEELCARKVTDIEMGRGKAVITVQDAKTKAGIRLVGVTHPVPLAVLKRRTKDKGAMLFPELKAGGYDDKLSASASKAFGRYRRACGVPDGTDFHSFRRNVVTVLEAAGVGQVAIARFVGHKVGTLAGDTYSQGGSREGAIETSRSVRYGKKVEAAAACGTAEQNET